MESASSSTSFRHGYHYPLIYPGSSSMIMPLDDAQLQQEDSQGNYYEQHVVVRPPLLPLSTSSAYPSSYVARARREIRDGPITSISRSRRRRRARAARAVIAHREQHGDNNGDHNNDQDNPLEGEGALQVVPPNNNNVFTIWEHICMLGARNFFIPSPTRRTGACIECYKRAAFYLCMIIIITGLFFMWNAALHPFRMMGRQFFVHRKYQWMFLTDDDFYPESAMTIMYVTIILAGFSVRYTNEPKYDHEFYAYLFAARALILCGFPTLVWHIWAHAANYPDDNFSTELESVMRDAMWEAKMNRLYYKSHLRRVLPLADRMWRDTQTVFKCCGVSNFQDWLPPRDGGKLIEPLKLEIQNFSDYVPKSCCEKLTGDVCEALYVHKSGCLEAQVKTLETESLWVINPGLFVAVLAHLALYLIMGRLFSATAAIHRTRRPFEPPPPTEVLAENEDEQNQNFNPVPI